MKEHDYKVVITTHAAIKIKASSKQEAEDKARDMMKDRVLEDTTMNVVVWDLPLGFSASLYNKTKPKYDALMKSMEQERKEKLKLYFETKEVSK